MVRKTLDDFQLEKCMFVCYYEISEISFTFDMAGWYGVNITVKFKQAKYKQKDVVE